MSSGLIGPKTLGLRVDCQVDWIKGCLHKTFPCGSFRVFLKEINIWFSRLSKIILPPQCGWALSNPLTALIKQRGKGRKILSLSLKLGHPSFHALRHGSPCSWALGFQDLCQWSWSSQVFDLRLGFTPMAPLVLKSSDSDWIISLDFQIL